MIGRWVQSLALALLVIFAFASLQSIASNSDRPVTAKIQGCEIWIQGELENHRLASVIEESLLPKMKHCRQITAHLESPGGLVWTGVDLGMMFRQYGINTRVDTYCNSACAIAFMGGRERSVSKQARVIAHSPHTRAGECVAREDYELDRMLTMLNYYLKLVAPNDTVRQAMTDCGRLHDIAGYFRG